MTQLADMSLADGLATPVVRLFTAVTPQNGINPAIWNYKAGSQRTSYIRAETLVRRSGSNAASVCSFKLFAPQVDPVTGIEKYRIITEVKMTIPDVASQADIDQSWAFLRSALGHAQVQGAFKDVSANM